MSSYNHRAVAAQMLGRPLERGEVVHHKNCVPGDNRADNLVVLGTGEHHRLHYGTDLLIGTLVPVAVAFDCGCSAYVNAELWGDGREVRVTRCALHKQFQDEASA